MLRSVARSVEAPYRNRIGFFVVFSGKIGGEHSSGYSPLGRLPPGLLSLPPVGHVPSPPLVFFEANGS